MKSRSPLPFRGASNNAAFYDTGSPFAPADNLRNVLRFDQTKDRPRIGVRPGSAEYFTGTFGGGQPVRGCGVVSRGRSASGFVLGERTPLPNTNGATRTQGAITGNIWRRATNWGLQQYTYENVTNTGPYTDTGVNTAPNKNVNAAAVSPDGTKIITGKTYDDGSGATVSRITCRNATTMAVIWSKKMDDPGINRFVNDIVCHSDWVFVFTNHFIRIFRLSDGANAPAGPSVWNFNGWSSEAIGGCLTGTNSMYALFRGSNIAATLPNGPTVSAGLQARHFRSGVMRLNIATAAQIAAGTATQILTQSRLGAGLSSGATYFEANHRYMRFSEVLPWGPRGLEPLGIAPMPSGGFAVIHANQAWGPRATAGTGYAPPDGTAGYKTLSTYTAAGVLDWWLDTESRTDTPDGSGFYNDIKNPTLLTIDADSDGNVYVSGRRTKDTPDADGTSCWAFNRYGDYLWDQDLGQTGSNAIRTLRVLPGSKNIVAGGDRNTAWPSSGGANAHLWELNKLDGSIIRTADLGAAVSVLGLEAFPDDTIVFGTDFV